MNIDLAKIDEKGILIDKIVSFDDSYLKNTPIKQLDSVSVKGKIYYSVTKEVVFECHVQGAFVLLDSLTLEPFDYPFDFEISEVLCEMKEEIQTKEAKRLDIMDILWQNIVLEVPIRARKNPKENIELSGEGWELVDEKVKKVDPRLAPLLELLEKEGKE